jgi:hypothetical protein
VGDSPEDIGGGVAAEAQVESAAGLIKLLPDGKEILVGRVGLVVVLSDGVADEEKLGVGVGADGVNDSVVTLGPPGYLEAVRGGDGRGDLGRDDWRRRRLWDRHRGLSAGHAEAE